MLGRTAPLAGEEPAIPFGAWVEFVHFLKFGSLVTPRCTVTASYALCSSPFAGIGEGPAWDPPLGGVTFAGVTTARAAGVAAGFPLAMVAFVVPGVCANSDPGLPPFARSGCTDVPTIGSG